MFLENLKIALTAIRANKMRSILTVLGVMIGVASVIAVVSIVQGLQHKLAADFESIGATFIRVAPDVGPGFNPFLDKVPELTHDDALAVMRGAPTISGFTPFFIANAEMKFGEARHSAMLIAVNQHYQEVTNHYVDRGRFFATVDEEARKRVAVLGAEVVRKLNLSDPLGKIIQVNGNGFTVVGVLEKRGATLGNDPDDVIYIPFATAEVIYGREQMKSILLALQVRSREEIDLAKDQVRDILRTRHGIKAGERDDFQLNTQEELMGIINGALRAVTLGMAAFVGIALIVGGIGIMNIMLVSVTERTREIGIRKAIGARRGDVLIQFLMEAIVLSGFGGVVGILGGIALANLGRLMISRFTDFPPVHTPIVAAVGAFAFCTLLGVIFGIYPAAKASKLDPIDALRYE